ncbi:YggT family protein [Exiguobacterium alkaliphilum]|uniref:YggT family protein n=1 Tax=Exiguobacterium alkaliphilum TaxID=1428684 RepID=UPI001BA891E8|nr:YggT family protein [Exiguobacterium alkaliphilum]QUE85722.1 YggT family protein [Exiguobacterium alkaliphilum]
MNNVVEALGNTIVTLLVYYSWVLIAYILLSWFPNARESKFGQILSYLCEPFLNPFRRIIPPIGGMLDISPIVALFVLRMAQVGVRAIFGL